MNEQGCSHNRRKVVCEDCGADWPKPDPSLLKPKPDDDDVYFVTLPTPPTVQEILNVWFEKHPPKELQEARRKIAEASALLNDALRLIRTFEGIDSE